MYGIAYYKKNKTEIRGARIQEENRCYYWINEVLKLKMLSKSLSI